MEFSKQQIEKTMSQYIQDNDDFGDVDETLLITETLNGFKSLILENNNNVVSSRLLQEHISKLKDTPKDIFEDFVLYLNMTEIDSHLL
jgi:hypothetical protein